MKIENTELDIQRVEVVKKVYDSGNRLVEERFEYYFPKNSQQSEVGFKPKTTKNV